MPYFQPSRLEGDAHQLGLHWRHFVSTQLFTRWRCSRAGPRWRVVVLITAALNAVLYLPLAIYCSRTAVHGLPLEANVDYLVPLSFLCFGAWTIIAALALISVLGEKVPGVAQP